MLLNDKCLFCGAMPKFFMMVHYSDHNNSFSVDGIGRYEVVDVVQHLAVNSHVACYCVLV